MPNFPGTLILRHAGRAPLVRLLVLLVCLGAGAGPGRPAEPATPTATERFAHPPSSSRILKIIHGWPDESAAQDGIIQRLQAQGFGGVVCNVSFDQYLESDAKWTAFRRAVGAARAAGMHLWLYDERGYPSAEAGGLVLRGHPEWEAEGLLVADADTDPGAVNLALPPGRVVLARAYPLHGRAIRLDEGIDLRTTAQEGKLTWTAPAGRWRVLAITRTNLFEGTHAEGNYWQKLPYPNLLEAAPTARFLELTHDRYARELGPELGRAFPATFTDEPSLMSMFLRRMPYRPLPWSEGLVRRFRERHGYEVDTILPALVTEVEPGAARYRHDFWSTVGELVAENYFGQIQTWCRAHGMKSGGHLLAEEGLTSHVALYGDMLRCLRRMDAPGIDCLTSLPADVPWYIARLAASAAELDGQRWVMCETSDHAQVYRPAGDTRPKRTVTEGEIRGTCNRLLVSGVNTITSYYSFTDLADDALRRLNEWVGRCATLLTGGHQVADVAVVYPIESAWTQFTPAFHWATAAPGANRVEHLYRSTLESLFEARRDFTVVDSRTLAEATVRRGELIKGPLRWRAVVLPGVDTLPGAAWRKLEEFVRTGGVVIALGAHPANSERDFPDARVRAWGERTFRDATSPPAATRDGAAGLYLPAGSEFLLPAVLDQTLEPDFAVAGRDAPVRVTHRSVEGRELYFLINDSPHPWQGTVKCRGTGAAQRWDPATGTVSAWSNGGMGEVALEPYGATFLSFPQARPAARPRTKGAAFANLTLRDLPVAAPSVVRGEFVRETFAALPAIDGTNAPARPAWRAQARITRSAVDTFLFVRLPLTPGVDLSDAEFLAVDTRVPAGQRAPTQLLVILVEQGGAEYLASTPRSLSGPEAERVHIPFTRFQLAGWSKDADATLDRARISEVRIGWGGYFGTENETVEFTFSQPQAGGVKRRE